MKKRFVGRTDRGRRALSRQMLAHAVPEEMESRAVAFMIFWEMSLMLEIGWERISPNLSTERPRLMPVTRRASRGIKRRL